MTITQTPEWHAARRTGIGSSDAAAAAGLSPWKTPHALWLEKVHGEHAEITNPDSVEWGTRLEGVILDWYRDATGLDVYRPAEMYRSSEHAFMVANLDGEIPGDRIVEAKTVDKDAFRFSDEWGEEGTANVPLAYLLQTQHAMFVTQYDRADLVALVGGNSPRIYPIPRDDDMIAYLIELEAAFWGYVERNEPPPAATVEEARTRWPQSVSREIGATAEILEACEVLRTLKAQAKAIDEQIELVQPAILEFLGEADTLTYGGATVATWRSSKGTVKLDTAALSAAHPEIVARFMRESAGARRFLLKTGPL